METIQRLALRGGNPYRTKPFPAWPEIDDKDIEGVLDSVKSGVWSRAKATNHLKFTYETDSKAGQFEQMFVRRLGVSHGIFVNSGTSALHLIVQALNFEQGSEIITTPYTFFSTVAPLHKFGMKPVFVDVGEDGNLDPGQIENAVTDRTKAVLIMHCGGQPCDMTALRKICDDHKLLLIQDNAHALTSTFDGRHVSSFGDVSMFSFEASKSLNCGEGGFVATDSYELFTRMFSIHSCGRPLGGDWRSHVNMSENFRPTEMQASLAITQLEKVDGQNARKDANRTMLDKLLQDNPMVEPIRLREGVDSSHGNYCYLLRIRQSFYSKLSGKRLAIYLETEGIPCHSGYRQLAFDIDYCRPFFREEELGRFRDRCPNAAAFVQGTVWLPQTVLLGDEEDVQDVAGAIDKITEALLD